MGFSPFLPLHIWETPVIGTRNRFECSPKLFLKIRCKILHSECFLGSKHCLKKMAVFFSGKRLMSWKKNGNIYFKTIKGLQCWGVVLRRIGRCTELPSMTVTLSGKANHIICKFSSPPTNLFFIFRIFSKLFNFVWTNWPFSYYFIFMCTTINWKIKSAQPFWTPAVP